MMVFGVCFRELGFLIDFVTDFVTGFVTRRFGSSTGESTTIGSSWADRHMAAALVNVAIASCGIGTAALPPRNGFLIFFGRMSLRGGMPGDDEAKTI